MRSVCAIDTPYGGDPAPNGSAIRLQEVAALPRHIGLGLRVKIIVPVATRAGVFSQDVANDSVPAIGARLGLVDSLPSRFSLFLDCTRGVRREVLVLLRAQRWAVRHDPRPARVFDSRGLSPIC